MRGIVAELNGKYAIVLAQDGSFRKIKAATHMTVGREVELNRPAGNVKVARLLTKVASIAAAALFILGFGYGAYSYTVPYSYVNVDINPSIELTANVYDIIIKTEALNDDGKKLLNNSRLKNIRFEAGVSQLLRIAIEQGYLTADTVNINTNEMEAVIDDQMVGSNTTSGNSENAINNAVIFTVSSADGVKSGVLKKELIAIASKELDKGNVNTEVLIAEASIKQRDDARKLGVTPGKLALIEDAIEGEPELKLEELKKAAVKDLIQKAKDKKAGEDKLKAAKEKEKDSSIGNSDKNTIDHKGVAAQVDEDMKHKQTIDLEQQSKQLADSNKKKEDTKKEEKKDELLEQMKDRKQEQNEVQQKEKQTPLNEGKIKKQNEGQGAAQKDKKGTSQQKKRN